LTAAFGAGGFAGWPWPGCSDATASRPSTIPHGINNFMAAVLIVEDSLSILGDSTAV
jgi:hypothetical protein